MEAYYILNHYLSPVHCVLLLAVFLIVFLIWHLIAKKTCGNEKKTCGNEKKSLTHSLLISLFVTYIFFILLITLIARTPADTRHIKLVPFWSWYEVIVNHSSSLAVEILLNILLFVPVGVGMRLMSDAGLMRVGIKRVAIICCCFSLSIELTQYFTCRGLMEWDDVIGNVCGACIGWLVCDRIVPLIKKRKER